MGHSLDWLTRGIGDELEATVALALTMPHIGWAIDDGELPLRHARLVDTTGVADWAASVLTTATGSVQLLFLWSLDVESRSVCC